MKKKIVEVGQQVWFTIGSGKSGLHTGYISKFGTKYITVNSHVFHIDSLDEKVDCGCNGHLYLREEDYWDEVELSDNISKIKSFFPGVAYGGQTPKVTVEQTRRILEILPEDVAS